MLKGGRLGADDFYVASDGCVRQTKRQTCGTQGRKARGPPFEAGGPVAELEVRVVFSRRLFAVSVAAAMAASLLPVTGAGAQDAPDPYFVRGVYGRDSSPTGVDLLSSVGFNTVTAMPYKADLDALAAKGMKAIVWLGEYHRTARCQFEFSDDLIRALLPEIAGHPAIYAYQLADEPTYARVAGCPAVADLKERAALIKSIDPSKPTYVTMTTWDGKEGHPYQYFTDTADILGLVVYPCSRTWDEWGGCQFGIIDDAIAEAQKDGVRRYLAVMQDFDDGWYRTPKADELKTQFDRWAGSNMEGYFVYHWDWGHVEDMPDHVAVYEAQNALFGSPVVEPAPTTQPTVMGRKRLPKPKHLKWSRRNATTVSLRWARPRHAGVAGFEVFKDHRLVRRTHSTAVRVRFRRVGRHVLRVRAFGTGGTGSPARSVVVRFCRGSWKDRHRASCERLARRG